MQTAAPGESRARADRAKGRARGLDQRTGIQIHLIGEPAQGHLGKQEALRERAGQTIADAELEPVLADVMLPGAAPVTPAAPDHRVAGDERTGPARVDAIAGLADATAPLVADPNGIRGGAVVQVRHRAGEQLDVGAADARPDHVDDHVAIRRVRLGDLGDGRRSRTGDEEGSHRAVLYHVAGSRARPRAGVTSWRGRTARSRGRPPATAARAPTPRRTRGRGRPASRGPFTRSPNGRPFDESPAGSRATGGPLRLNSPAL